MCFDECAILVCWISRFFHHFRLVLEGDQPILYYTLQNSRVYHEKDPLGIEILSRVWIYYALALFPGSLPLNCEVLCKEGGTAILEYNFAYTKGRKPGNKPDMHYSV